MADVDGLRKELLVLRADSTDRERRDEKRLADIVNHIDTWRNRPVSNNISR